MAHMYVYTVYTCAETSLVIKVYIKQYYVIVIKQAQLSKVSFIFTFTTANTCKLRSPLKLLRETEMTLILTHIFE